MIEVELEHAQVVFTGRRGGVSKPPFDSLNLGILTEDDPDLVRENREIALKLTQARELRWNVQVHGTTITNTADAETPVEADGLVTEESGLGLLVLAADCLPVALGGPGRVAMIHAGWRGLAGGILPKAAALFTDGFDAAIGPGICQEHYEISDDVLGQFQDWPTAVRGGNLDLKQVARLQLEAAGARSVSDVNRCTYCEPAEFFSHRRDNGVTGRQAGIAWLK